MRKLLLICCILFVCAWGTTAYAGGYEDPCDSYKGKYLNECADNAVHHDHRDNPLGIGADVVLWQNETDKVTFIEEVVAEVRHDFENQETSVYGVVRVNLWQKIKGLFSKD
jgi:hypothetical protein